MGRRRRGPKPTNARKFTGGATGRLNAYNVGHSWYSDTAVGGDSETDHDEVVIRLCPSEAK